MPLIDPRKRTKPPVAVRQPLTYGPSGVKGGASFAQAGNADLGGGTVYNRPMLGNEAGYIRNSAGEYFPGTIDHRTDTYSNTTSPAFGKGIEMVNAYNQPDQPPGMTMEDFLAAMGALGNGGGGGGGGRGGGGGGGGRAAAQGQHDALAAYLAQLQGQDPSKIFRDRLAGLGSEYDARQAGLNTRFDGLGSEVGAAGQAGSARMGDIVRLMQERGGVGRQRAGESFQATDSRLQDLGSQFGLADQGNANRLNQILSAFGAGSVDAMAQPTQNLFNASRVNNAAVGGMYDQNFVDRQNISDNLGQDINRQLSAQEQSLMNQLAVKRAAETQGLQSERSAQEFAIQQQMLQAQQQQLQQENAIRLQMAQLGIG